MLVPQVFAGDVKSVLAAAGQPPEIAMLVNAMAVILLFAHRDHLRGGRCTNQLRSEREAQGDTVRVGWKVSSATKASDGH